LIILQAERPQRLLCDGSTPESVEWRLGRLGVLGTDLTILADPQLGQLLHSTSTSSSYHQGHNRDVEWGRFGGGMASFATRSKIDEDEIDYDDVD